jgi:hypothetical protein
VKPENSSRLADMLAVTLVTIRRGSREEGRTEGAEAGLGGGK